MTVEEGKACFDAIAGATVGLRISHIWRGHGSALFVELGALAPSFRSDGSLAAPAGQIRVALGFCWRIKNGNRIICDSSGDDAFWAKAFERMHDEVSAVKLKDRQISIELARGGRIESVFDADDPTQWTLFDERLGQNFSLSIDDRQFKVEHYRPALHS